LAIIKKEEAWYFFHWISSNVKTFKPIRAWYDTFLAIIKKEEAWYFFHWISSSVKNIQALSGLEIISGVSFDLP
jgi:hypothetical protein